MPLSACRIPGYYMSLMAYLSVAYLLAELSELLTHSLGNPKCVAAGISGCSDIFVIKRIAKRTKKGREDRTRINHE